MLPFFPQGLSSDDSSPAATLPFDILEVIAKHLVAQDWHRTCANFAMTSKAVQEQLNPILWKRVVYRWDNSRRQGKKAEKWKQVFKSEGAKYIQ
jgi:hypothetical protein